MRRHLSERVKWIYVFSTDAFQCQNVRVWKTPKLSWYGCQDKHNMNHDSCWMEVEVEDKKKTVAFYACSG